MAKYNLNIALIERDYDIAEDISFINTAVVYDGSENSDPIMSMLEKIGSKLVAEACYKFKVPNKKVGALRIADSCLLYTSYRQFLVLKILIKKDSYSWEQNMVLYRRLH